MKIRALKEENLFEKFAVAPVFKVSSDSAHTLVHLKVHDGWVVIDNDEVEPEQLSQGVLNPMKRSHAIGRSVVIYRKKRGNSKKFYPRFVRK